MNESTPRKFLGLTFKGWLGVSGSTLTGLGFIVTSFILYHGKFQTVHAAEIQQAYHDNILTEIRLDNVKSEIRDLKRERDRTLNATVKARIQIDIDELLIKQQCIEDRKPKC